MIALIIGALLAVGALAYVLYPIFFGAPQAAMVAPSETRSSETDNAVAALREIEFDRETGKLSDSDYAELKTRYTNAAIRAMRTEGPTAGAAAVAPSLDEEIEARVRAYRQGHLSCPEHGPRPEPDAVYCSTCGRYLRDTCVACGAPVDASDARFCANCGRRLAA